MKSYLVKENAWINGDYHAKGVKISMHPDAAKYHVLNGTLEEVADAPAPAKTPVKK